MSSLLYAFDLTCLIETPYLLLSCDLSVFLLNDRFYGIFGKPPAINGFDMPLPITV